MNYSALIAQLYHLNLYGGMKLGLSNSLRLDQCLGYPSKGFASIHIAGTNGKGSVATKIAKALEHNGLKVGLYTSPHLSCFRERIQINGSMISEKTIEQLLPKLFEAARQQDLPATFFEMTTLLAFTYFAQEKVDIAVLETGLGGRLDATNIVVPILSAITSISLEHTETLGGTIEQIAQEKAGIIKPGIPIVIGPHVPRSVIHPIAERNQSPCIEVQGSFASYDLENRAIARKCLEVLHIDSHAIEKGLQTIPPCRLEIVEHSSQSVILDVAHNPDGFSNLLKSLQIKFPFRLLYVICGLSKSKDIQGCLRLLKPHAAHFYPVEAPNGRGLPQHQLKNFLLEAGVPEESMSLFPTISRSVKYALENSPIHSAILICGSFFIMSEARQALGIEEPCDSLDMNEKFSFR